MGSIVQSSKNVPLETIWCAPTSASNRKYLLLYLYLYLYLNFLTLHQGCAYECRNLTTLPGYCANVCTGWLLRFLLPDRHTIARLAGGDDVLAPRLAARAAANKSKVNKI